MEGINWVNKKVFYLEYDERNDQESLASQLTHLGGHVVTFLSKTVDFVVTKAGKNKFRFLPSITPGTHQSRAATMVTKSQTREVKGLSCVTEIAKRWNIKILKYEYVSRLIKQLHKRLNIGTSQATDIIVRKLKHPFIKVEDTSGLYRPCYKEFKEFPSINFKSELGGCPFDYPGTSKGSDLVKNCQNTKIRFCECCNVTYTDLNVHLESRKHREFASNDSNYARIDEFIIKNGLDVETFKAKMYKKHNVQEH